MFLLKRFFLHKKSFFDKYKIIYSQKLGNGAFGSVYLGKRKSEGNSIAVKIIPIKHKEDCAREIEILRMLPTHANVCGFIDSFEDENNIYIVLEHINGQNLYEYLEPHLGNYLTKIPFFLEIIQQCVQAIAAIHAAGIFHRDLKLENFMITFDKAGKPLIKLIDFGLSEIIREIQQMRVGSAFWMAPEVIREGGNHQISIQSDIWSFGMIILELFCGNPLFSELPHFDQLRTVATLSSPPIPQKLMDDATAIGIWFRSLATMCLQIDPNSRPTAGTLAVFSKTCSISAA
jgi:protein-serine/threonine kinase